MIETHQNVDESVVELWEYHLSEELATHAVDLLDWVGVALEAVRRSFV